MADIELVIKIPEKTYKQLKFLNEQGFGTVIDELVVNGIPLPKGHGRLIDADKIKFDSNYFYDGDDTIIAEETINDMPTIIEADKENLYG